jgi:hypothetical protein
MYRVVNISKKLIHLRDLNVTFEKGQMLDLDRFSKSNPRESGDLKYALRSGMLKVMSFDSGVSSDIEGECKAVPVIDDESIRNIIQEELSKSLSTNLSTKQILDAINELKNNIPSGGGTVDSKVSEQLQDDFVDEKALEKLHSKTMNRKMKKLKTGIKVQENKVISDDDYESNLHELEGLL